MPGDTKDGVTDQTHDTPERYGAPHWTLPGSTDRGVLGELPTATGQATRQNIPRHPNTLFDPLHMLDKSHEQLLAERKILLELLSQTQTELNAARQAIRDLATWMLHERTRLMSEVQLQEVSREDLKVVLSRKDNEIQEARALEQEAKLEHARTLIREGDALGQPVSAIRFHKINEMRVQAGLPRMDRFGAMQESVKAQLGTHAGAHGEEMMHDFTHVLYADTDQEDESFELDEGSYSPPSVCCSLSVQDQVDQLIAEEKSKWPAINEEARRIAAGLNEAKASVQDDTGVARNANIASDKRVTIRINNDKAVQVMHNLSNGTTEEAVASRAKPCVKSPPIHKATIRWIQAHIWESAAVIFPPICTACTAGILWLVGFTAVGVRKLSVVAGIQAAIGKVAAGSTFAVFTSAAMGGYGAAIVFGSAWLIPTVFLGAVAAFKRWKGARRATKGNVDDGGKPRKDDGRNTHKSKEV